MSFVTLAFDHHELELGVVTSLFRVGLLGQATKDRRDCLFLVLDNPSAGANLDQIINISSQQRCLAASLNLTHVCFFQNSLLPLMKICILLKCLWPPPVFLEFVPVSLEFAPESLEFLPGSL